MLFSSVDVPKAQAILSQLHEQVVNGNGRVELTSNSVEGTSVIISKEELSSLEEALAILSDSSDVRRLCENLETLGRDACVF